MKEPLSNHNYFSNLDLLSFSSTAFRTDVQFHLSSNGLSISNFSHHLVISGYLGTPLVMGKLKNIDSFDSEFFGVHSRSANTMDPMLRIMLEVVYEAVVDAGKETSINN